MLSLRKFLGAIAILAALSAVNLHANDEEDIIFKENQSHFGIQSDLEYAQNREAWNSIDQNAYFSFRMMPYYSFANKWSVAVTGHARQQVKPQRLWRWADTKLSVSSPSWNLSDNFLFSIAGNVWLPTSKFSRDDLQRYLAVSLAPKVTWITSRGETWTLNKIVYYLDIQRDFHHYRTDVAGNAVDDWIVAHALDFDILLWKNFTFTPDVSFDSEFRSSGVVLNTYALQGTLNYDWSENFSSYLKVVNSGDSYQTQERFGRLGNFGSRDTEFDIGVGYVF